MLFEVDAEQDSIRAEVVRHEYRSKATGKDTNGHFGLFEFVMEPGTEGASPHIHKQLTEMFYVVEGEVELVLRSSDCRTRSLCSCQNTPHGFSIQGKRDQSC